MRETYTLNKHVIIPINCCDIVTYFSSVVWGRIGQKQQQQMGDNINCHLANVK